MNLLKQFFPVFEWAKEYSSSALKGDAFAGLTVGIMLIPQGMAYAMIAGLPPVYGLYAISPTGTCPYETSRQLAVDL